MSQTKDYLTIPVVTLALVSMGVVVANAPEQGAERCKAMIAIESIWALALAVFSMRAFWHERVLRAKFPEWVGRTPWGKNSCLAPEAARPHIWCACISKPVGVMFVVLAAVTPFVF